MSIYFEEKGSLGAPTIVFLHGGGVAGWMWERQAEHFSDYHCIIPDLPEHGKSAAEGPLSLSDCADRIASLIETRANGGRAHLVGHSLGGKVIVELLAKRRELVISAVAASALYRPIAMLTAIHRPMTYKIVAGMLRSRAVLKLAVRNFKFPDKTYFDNCMNDFGKLTADSLYREYDQLYQYLKLPQGLDRASVPVLAVAGSREPKAMRQSVRDIAAAIRGASGAYVLKGDHTYPWSMYEGFNTAVRSWIEGRGVSGPSFKEI